MNSLVENLLNSTTTENGRTAFKSTKSAVLDLFSIAGNLRTNQEKINEYTSRFELAYLEDPTLTLKCLFWMRDVRGGAGVRSAFRSFYKWLIDTHPEVALKYLKYIPEFGRWDDVFIFMGTSLEKDAINLIIERLNAKDGLLAKWLPRLGGKVSSEKKLIANKVRVAAGLSAKQYRKLIVSLTNVVETKLCEKKFNEIEYSKVPSVAMTKYNDTFRRKDPERFSVFLNNVATGVEKINTGAVYPHDVIKMLGLPNSDDTAQAMWDNLPNYLSDNAKYILPVCDCSGSMYTGIRGTSVQCIDIAHALTLYTSERNLGPFKDCFIPFSRTAKLAKVSGGLRERVRSIREFSEVANTDIDAVFDLILSTATRFNVPQSDMPQMILILSDMQFDGGVNYSSTAHETIERNFKSAGYDVPGIVYWNLASDKGNHPVTHDTLNAALVSGFSPSILTSVLSATNITPYEVMLKTLNSERYSVIN